MIFWGIFGCGRTNPRGKILLCLVDKMNGISDINEL